MRRYLNGEPRSDRKSKSGRVQGIIRCTACGRDLYRCAAWGNEDIGRYHFECRPVSIWPDQPKIENTL